MFDLSGQRQEIITANGHLLVMGGPGSGKTTIALLKAKHIIESSVLRKEQKVLFLSFARATITRVEQQVKPVFGVLDADKLEITTYHSFIWTILKSHGYLLTQHRLLRLLPPYEASSAFSGLSKEAVELEKRRLLTEDGRIHFDLFAHTCKELLARSNALRELFGASYPLIFLDEFQDTDSEQWALIQLLGRSSTLVALADLEQRIYGFRGASPERINEFKDAFHPQSFDFRQENNRSNGTDIVAFGNDLLTGINIEKSYQDVHVYKIASWNENMLFGLKYKLLDHVKNLKRNQEDWSIAVLVPSNNLMLKVSDFLSRIQKTRNGSLPQIQHDVAVDVEGPTIAAIVIAEMMDAASCGCCTMELLVRRLREHILGRSGENHPTTKRDSALAQTLSDYLTIGKKTKEKNLLAELGQIVTMLNALCMTGDVASDWVSVRSAFKDRTAECLKQIYVDSFFIKLLHKGSALNTSLGEIWRANKNYIGAASAVDAALTQEYFATATKTWQSVNVMTIHKSKGKEFDVVIIYEEKYAGRFVNRNGSGDARLVLRVAATRARKHVDIMTPQDDPCPLLQMN